VQLAHLLQAVLVMVFHLRETCVRMQLAMPAHASEMQQRSTRSVDNQIIDAKNARTPRANDS
jgi:hypothetical protein